MSVTIKTDAVSNNPNLKYAVRDNLLANFATSSSNVDGILLFSLDDKFSFNKQATPVDGDSLNNIANAAQNLTYFKASSAVGDVTWDDSAKAIDFSAVGVGVNGVRSDATWLVNEFNGQNKRFILTAYVFIPEAANWHTKSSGLVDFAGTVSEDQASNQTEILGSLCFVHHPTDPNEYQIWAKFSSADHASGVATIIPYAVPAGNSNFPFGKLAQISLVRDATGNYLYVISSKGITKITSTNTAITGKDVTTAGNRVTWGRGKAYAPSLLNKYKLSRGFIINLNKHAIPDIQAFLKADWDRQVARGRIS